MNLTFHRIATKQGLGLSLAGILWALCGCVAQRGIDFGHWAGTSERISLTRTYNIQKNKRVTANNMMVLLPPLGNLPPTSQNRFPQILLQEAQKYFPARAIDVASNGNLKEYVSRDNLSPTAGVFDFQEAARVGRLFGASYVLCTWVREARVHPPQSLVLYFVIIDVASSRSIGEMDAAYNASEQEVVMAARNHLQSRLARRFDSTSLNILLRSPEEYQTFVAAECMSTLADLFK